MGADLSFLARSQARSLGTQFAEALPLLMAKCADREANDTDGTATDLSRQSPDGNAFPAGAAENETQKLVPDSSPLQLISCRLRGGAVSP